MTALDMDLEVRRNYVFTFKGQRVEFNEDEFLEARTLFNEKFKELNTKQRELNDVEIRKLINEFHAAYGIKKAQAIQKEPKTIPTEYRIFGKTISEPRNGHGGKQYIYFTDDHGSYAFQIENDDQFFFVKLGNINDESSLISRFVEKIPYDSNISKSTMIAKKVVTNSAYVKALFDVLVITKEIVRVFGLDDGRNRELYRRVRKSKSLYYNVHGSVTSGNIGLEGVKTHDFGKVKVTSFPNN